MARVVVPSGARDGDSFRLEGEAFRHAVQVLRIAPGERLCIVDGSGAEFDCVALALTGRTLLARIVGERPLAPAARLSLRLCCALLKGDKLDLVLQKGTEMGVDDFLIYEAQRSTVRIAAGDEAPRRGRWERIVHAAVGQCGRASVPRVRGPLAFGAMINEAALADVAVMPWEGDGCEALPRLSSVTADAAFPRAAGAPLTAAVVVGPEGGFTSDEVEAARGCGIVPVTLGARVLRAETAAIIAPALMLAAAGDLG